jgi:Tol biopolymer transport system component/tRNA A-37 threonylcarbamoyl transferase component Bud32
MTLSAGTRLGPYEILSPLGAGGMGEVYKARDPKLGREIAIKVLPERTAQDAEALARFEREARAVAALNHPNILGIYDFGREGALAYAVMELLEGESLRDRLEAGAIPVRKAVDYAHQMAIGLAAAHERGIVHRDLKPENVFLTNDGRVKILDFGLAKRIGPASAAAEATSAPTMSQQTDPGTVMGTVGYMSPEQVRGLAVDARSDLFAFGAILYEMLSGRRAFRRDTAGDTMSAILRDEPPDLVETGRNIPPGLDRIVRHCLEKNPAERFHSARDVAFDLEAVGTASTSTARAAAVSGARFRVRPGMILAAAIGVAAGILFDRVVRRQPEPALVAIRPLTHSGQDFAPAVSPDGKTIAFSSSRDGTMRIWLKQLATGDEVALTPGPDFRPRFSPDGTQILFIHGGYQPFPMILPASSDLYRVPVIGGTPRKLAAGGSDGDWSPDGKTIAFVTNSGSPATGSLYVVAAEGGEPKRIGRWTSRVAGPPRFSPDGKTIAIPSLPANAGGGAKIELVAADGSADRTLPVPASLGALSNAVWDAAGKSLFFAQGMNVVYGATRLVHEDVASGRATPLLWMSFNVLHLDALGPQRLVADSASSRQNLAEFSLADLSAPPRWLTRGTGTDRQPVFTPDGQWVAFSSNRDGNLDIWEVSPTSGAIRRMTEDAADDWDPGFTRDGKLIWSSGRTGRLEIWMADADGAAPHALTRRNADAENPTAAPDGSIYYSLTSAPEPGLWRIRPDGSPEARIGACINIPETSPDGRYVACPDIDTGAIRVVRVDDKKVLPFTIEVPHPRPTEIFMGRPRWSPDGRRLYFIGQDEKGINGVYVQDFDPEKADTSATRRKVAGFDPNLEAESFAISPDGKRLVVAFLDRTYGISTIEGVRGVERGKRP